MLPMGANLITSEVGGPLAPACGAVFVGCRFAKNAANTYLRPMYDFCLPTTAKAVPTGPDYIHEIKYDGYRLMVARSGDRVRLITKGGYDWTRRFPWIVE